jgi:hypothetical protein
MVLIVAQIWYWMRQKCVTVCGTNMALVVAQMFLLHETLNALQKRTGSVGFQNETEIVSVDALLLSQCGCTLTVTVWMHSYCHSVDAPLLSQCGCTLTVTVWMHPYCHSVDAPLLSQCRCTLTVTVWMHSYCHSVDALLLSQCGCTLTVTLWMHATLFP